MPCRPLKEYAPGFLGHYLNAPAFHIQLVPLMQGIKVIALSKTAMADTTVTVPAVEEQAKISGIFSCLDDLITLHQRKQLAMDLGWSALLDWLNHGILHRRKHMSA